MSEMTERVMQAIFDAVPFPRTENHPVPNNLRGQYWNMARAAMAAMREPTDGMSRAAFVVIDEILRGDGIAETIGAHAYMAAIDEALAGKTVPMVRREGA